MSFFTLPELFRARKGPPQTEAFTLPYNLKPSTWNQLRALRNDEGFSAFVELIDEAIKLNGEILLGASTDESLHFYRGRIQGLRQAATLIDEIAAAETLHKEQDQKRKDARQISERSRVNATFGSPSWRPLDTR